MSLHLKLLANTLDVTPGEAGRAAELTNSGSYEAWQLVLYCQGKEHHWIAAREALRIIRQENSKGEVT